MVQRSVPDTARIAAKHLEKIVLAFTRAGFADDERPNVEGWLHIAAFVVGAADVVAIRRHAASGVAKAAALEAHARNRRLADWKMTLIKPGPNGDAASSTPSRRAYQWIRGATGWSKSPIADAALNDAVLECQALEEDVAPAHLLEDTASPARVWKKTSGQQAPLAEQSEVELEANFWATLWDEECPYDAFVDPHGSPALPPLRAHDLRTASLSFPAGTGLGADHIAPRALARLSDEALRGLCAILMAAELLGKWPKVAMLVLIMLLPKPDGGRRPIGLFPVIVRIWARARAQVARQWETDNARAGLFGGPSMGAQKAAWQAAFRAEAAALTRSNYAQALLDLVKAFEKVPHDVLFRLARERGFNLWLVRLSVASYRLARSIGIDGSYSRLVMATRGITAGSVFATSELRIIMLDAMDFTTRIWPTVSLSVYVDDCTLECEGPGARPAAAIAGASDTLIGFLENVLRLEVSVLKSVASGSSFSLARRTARMSISRKLTAVRAAKLLGTPAAGGRRRCTAPQRARVRKVRGKAKRLKMTGMKVSHARTMVRSAGTPAISYGWDAVGVSDSALRVSRSLIASMLSSSEGGKNPDAVLMVTDSAGGSIDPAYDAHCLPIKHWATAYWERWQPGQLLAQSFEAAAVRVADAVRSPWDVVTGPAAALIASLWRVNWDVLSPAVFVDDLGRCVDCRRDSPAYIVERMKESVRRWQGLRVLSMVPGAIPDAPDLAAVEPHRPPVPARFCPRAIYCHARLPRSVRAITAPIGNLLQTKACRSKIIKSYGHAHRPWLRSAVVGGQWPQIRIAAAAGDADMDTCCQLCHAEPGTLQHRSECEATKPPGGRPMPPAQIASFVNGLSGPRRLALATRGMLGMWIPRPPSDPNGWLRWLIGDPAELTGEARWYIDGSCFDIRIPGHRATGFGILAVGEQGQVLAAAHGRPPEFVLNAPGAEAWALHIVLSHVAQPPMITTDCLGLISQLVRGFDDALSSRKPLARVWALIANSLDHAAPADWTHRRFRWMPAHKARSAIGTAFCSDGSPVTFLDWRANRLVDMLAKAAAARGRAPRALRSLLDVAAQAVEFSAALLGLTTHAANSYTTTEWRADGTAHTLTRRDAQPPAFLAKGRGQRPRATGPRPQQPLQRPHPAAPASAQDEGERATLENNLRARLDHQKAAKNRARQEAADRADAQEARALAAWHRDQAAAPPRQRPAGAPTAAERLEALRRRVADKSASS